MTIGDIDYDSFLGSTSIKARHVEQAFREFVNDDSIRLTNLKAETIAVGQGFTSYILRLTLAWREEDTKKHDAAALPKSVILKALSKDSIEKLFDSFKMTDGENAELPSMVKNDFSQMLILGHKMECVVYELMNKKRGKTAPVPIAQAYATWIGAEGDDHPDPERPPLILLEDLGDRARVLGDGTASLTLEQAYSIVEAQADLHAWSMTTDESWRDNMQTFADRLKLFANFMPMMIQGLRRAKEAYPDAFGNLDEAKVLRMMGPQDMERLHYGFKEWMPEVLIHGDFWANNVMFNKLPDGSMGDQVVAFIDWQLPLVGNPFIDIGRMLSMSFDGDLRDAHMKDVIKRYYDHLEKKLGDRKPSTLTFDKVLAEAEKQTAISCLMLCVMQDTMQSLFVSGEGVEAEEQKARMIQRTKDGVDYAAKYLDILTG